MRRALLSLPAASLCNAASEKSPPVRAITKGPFHEAAIRSEWTVCAWMEADFENRSPDGAGHPSQGEKSYLYKNRSEQVEVVGPDVTVNGHYTYLPGSCWILNDTYPDKERLQYPYLYDTKTGTRVPLGHFLSPMPYQGERRCDLHPRPSPDGRRVCRWADGIAAIGKKSFGS